MKCKKITLLSLGLVLLWGGAVVASNPPATTPAVSQLSEADRAKLKLILKEALLNELEKSKKNDRRNAPNWQQQIDSIQRGEGCSPNVSLGLVYTIFPEICHTFKTALAVKQALLALNNIDLYGTVYGVCIFTISGGRQSTKRLGMGPKSPTTGRNVVIQSDASPSNAQIQSITWDRNGAKLKLIDNSDKLIAELTIVDAPVAAKKP